MGSVRYPPVATFVAGLFFLFGCSMSHAAVSTDIRRFREIVDIEFPLASAKWEIFGTPEYKGGPPGPTDFITLIAELHSAETRFFRELSIPTGNELVAPEATREWLSLRFREMLAAKVVDDKEFSAKFNCREYSTTMRQSGRKVSGFICPDGEVYLLYLTLVDNTA